MDWIDEADGVFRGGGVKGLGLAGALLGMAEHPTKPINRWVNVAGASAGAIIAATLACGKTPADLEKLLRETDFAQFQDFPLRRKLIGGVPNLLLRHGLARGEAFRTWLSAELGGATFASVRSGDAATAGHAEGHGWRLKLIAADITFRRLLVLPEDLSLYRLPKGTAPIDPDDFEIATAARMSMSIPYFFEPMQLVDNATGRTATIVDGGTLSNFPVWLFDVADRAPARPTFGFTLKGGHGVGEGLHRIERLLPWGVRTGFDMFHTAQEAWDQRFQSHSTRVRTLAVDAADVSTTDFTLSRERQELLVGNGRAAAKEFLDAFRLESYINTFHRTIVEGDAV